MLIVCPNCGTSYQIEPGSLGPGRSVRCMRCRNVWFAANTNAMAAIAKAHREDLSRLKALPAAAAPPFAPPPSPPGALASQIDSLVSVEAEQVPVAADSNDGLPDDPALPGATAPLGTERPPLPEPMLIDHAPPLAPMDPVGAIMPDGGEDIETVAASRARRSAPRRRGWPLGAWPTAILAQMLLVMALVLWRTQVVQLLPQTASLFAAIGLPVNLRGLEFTGVETESEATDGVQVLVVQGTILSTANHRVDVPRLRF